MSAMNFRDKWMSWLKGGVLNNFIFILVNGSAPKEFKATRSLLQGDPLSPFIFSVVAEGPVLLVRRLARKKIFSGFHLYGDEAISLVQFADESVLICDDSWKNL
ncbi:unnamed protein product [Lathyrus sativus]|nr:unnamed protein product [Lathyrus sativus]